LVKKRDREKQLAPRRGESGRNGETPKRKLEGENKEKFLP